MLHLLHIRRISSKIMCVLRLRCFSWHGICRLVILGVLWLLFWWVFRSRHLLFRLLLGSLCSLEIRFLDICFVCILPKRLIVLLRLLIWKHRHFPKRSYALCGITIGEFAFVPGALEMLQEKIICVCNDFLHVFLFKSVFRREWIV